MIALALAVPVDTPAGQRANVRIKGAALRGRVERVLDGAGRRFASRGCAHVLATFRSVDGRSLAQVLADSRLEPTSYFDTILYYEGLRSGPCANAEVLAVTSPGARVVLVCSEFDRYSRLEPGWAEAILVHEVLHTLGLGENPPRPDEITQAVLRHCR